MSVDEMIIASINCLDGIEEHFKTQMIAWVRIAADFGEINDQLVKENTELKADNDARKFAMAMSENVEKQLREENAELKAKVGLSIDCEKDQKNGELCLGYGSDEDKPCERCKNCIKCEGGYYQLGETEKDAQLTKAEEIIRTLYYIIQGRIDYEDNIQIKDSMDSANAFLNEVK